jgi:hypothetical protein
MPVDIKILYIEIYVSFLLAVIVYVLMELFKVEKEQAAGTAAEARPPIEFPRYSVWLVAIGMFLVIAGWLVSFPVNEAVKKMAGSNDYVDGITTTAKWLFFPGTVLVAISLLVFGYKGAIHTRPASWFYIAGIVAIGVGILAFCASAAVGCVVRSINSETTPIPEVILITGLLNPFFFAGVPLGIYWLSRSKQKPAVQPGKRK